MAAKRTLLELTQSILAAMESDEVNSIGDTVESYDIALLLRDVYYDLSVDLNLESHETLFELEASGDPTQPVLMNLPSNVQTLYWIKYNNQLTGETNSNYLDVNQKIFNDFITMQRGLTFNTSNVGEMSFDMNSESFEIMYSNDVMPTWFTQVGNDLILFNSYDVAEDTTLQKNKTMCGGLVYPTFTLTDLFIPDLDASQFPYYLNKAKYRAFVEHKQVDNKEAQAEARNQKVLIQKRKHKINNAFPAIKNFQTRYGRK